MERRKAAAIKREEMREVLRERVAEASQVELEVQRMVLKTGQRLLEARHDERRALERENTFWLGVLEARARGGGGCVIL